MFLFYSIIAGDVGACSVVAAPSSECPYVDKVTHLCVYVILVSNLKKLLALSCVMATKTELQKVEYPTILQNLIDYIGFGLK